jgi:hypothetical protein
MSSFRCRVTAIPRCLSSSMQPTTTARPVAVEERDDLLEALLAVLEVDRVDDRLPLTALERLLEHARVGRVEHERDLDLSASPLEERDHVHELVAIGVREADVEDLRAAAHLPAADLAAWSRSPATTSSLNFLLPITFVRSPTTTGRRSSSIGRTSMPDDDRATDGAAVARPVAARELRRGRGCARPSSRSSRPMMFTQPSAQKRSTFRTSDSGVSL